MAEDAGNQCGSKPRARPENSIGTVTRVTMDTVKKLAGMDNKDASPSSSTSKGDSPSDSTICACTRADTVPQTGCLAEKKPTKAATAP